MKIVNVKRCKRAALAPYSMPSVTKIGAPEPVVRDLKDLPIPPKTIEMVQKAYETRKNPLETNSHILDMLIQIGIDVGVDISISVAKKIIKRTAQWLATRTATTLITKIGTRIMARIGISAITRMIAMQALTKAVTLALSSASAALTGIGIVLIIFSIISIIYDLVDPRGYNQMLNKAEVEQFVVASRTLFMQEASKHLPIGGEFPPEVIPMMYAPPNILKAAGASSGKETTVLKDTGKKIEEEDLTVMFLTKVVEYINGLEVNSNGELIDLSDEAHPEIPDPPNNPADWHKLLMEEFTNSRRFDYQRRLREKSRKMFQAACIFSVPCLLYGAV